MDDKTLENIQKELEQQIDKDVTEEKIVVESSIEIAKNILNAKNHRCKAIINNEKFLLSYMPYINPKDNKRMICILSVNIAHYKISLGNYRPAKIEAEFDDNFTEEENLQRVIESYIRHVTGLIKPEEIE